MNFNEWVAHVQLNILMKHKISGLHMRTRDDIRTYSEVSLDRFRFAMSVIRKRIGIQLLS